MIADSQLKKQEQELENFINSHPDPRELKRAMAASLTLQGYAYRTIVDVLKVSFGFVSKWKNRFVSEGVQGLKLAYKGATSYLSISQKREVIQWILSQDYWDISQLDLHLVETYGVEFKSKQSYYSLLKEAKITWQKSRNVNSRKKPELVKTRNEEIAKILEKMRPLIESEDLILYILDECHLVWGDVCGHVWGHAKNRLEIPIANERERQTYYGALNYFNKEFTLAEYESGNGKNSVEFVKQLQAKNPGKRIVLIWDGAGYHRGKEMQNFLAEVNQGLEPEEWRVTCIQFPPYAPESNPVEAIWLQGKNLLRRFYPLCKTFKIVKRLFHFFLEQQIFDFPNFHKYEVFSRLN